MISSFGSYSVQLQEERMTLLHAGVTVRSWPATSVRTLSTREAAKLGPGQGMVIDQATPDALAMLREAGVSYVTRSGEWHLADPPGLLVLKPADRGPLLPPRADRPLGRGAARIARWLLLHPERPTPSVTELAQHTLVSAATSSRSLRQLAERDLVSVATAADGRRREVAIRDAHALLDTLADEGPWRWARRTTWDVDCANADEALVSIRRAADAAGRPEYAVGGLAGAATVNRLAEPADVRLWLPEAHIPAWRDALDARPSRPAPGRVTVCVAPDPVVLRWATEARGLLVADLVQLYIDCRYAGERAVDTTESLRREVLGLA